jgi:hypothetical protein
MTAADKDADGKLIAPLWDVNADMVVGGVMYLEGSVVRSWNLPLDSRLKPINANAKRLARYALKVRHHPAKPKSASTRHGLFLPAQLVFGDSVTRLVELFDDMPCFSLTGILLGWPGTSQERGYDKPQNEAAAALMSYWREHKDHPDLPEHACWCALRDQLFLPPLSKRERPAAETLPAYVGAPKPSGYVPSDSRSDSVLVPARPLSGPTPRLRRIRETHAVQRGEIDPHGRR